MPNDPILDQLLLAQGQGEQAVVANHQFTIGHRFATLIAEDITNAQPGSPVDGQAWIVSDEGGAISGADWTSANTPGGPAADGDVAFYLDGWYIVAPNRGMAAVVVTRGYELHRWRGAAASGEKWGPVEFGRFDTTERVSPRQDINGDELRVKAFSLAFPATPDTEASAAHGITNLVAIRGVTATAENAGVLRPVPYVDSLSGESLWWRVDGTNLYAGADFAASSWTLALELVYVVA